MARTVAIGYDGSENAGDALALGGVLAELLGAQPLVVAVVPKLPEATAAGDHAQTLTAETASLFATARERLSGFDVITRAISDRSPGRALHQLAEAEMPSVMVLGSSHRGRVGRAVAGSVGEAMLSGAAAAIAIAPRGYARAPNRHVLRIAAAVHGTESDPAVHAAIALAERTHASLTLISVAEPHRYGYGEAFAVLAGDFEEMESHIAAESLELAAKRVPPSMPVERRVLHGDPVAMLTECAEDFDLLALGSRGYGPIRRVLLGTVSAPLVRDAPCPVLVLPRGTSDDPLGLEEA